ncbi:MAG: hypothetical protein JO354_13590 [Verrucomicrobia bacterium]|nr:hypothetical protein [Verrucomicrobiota bacterium]
MMKLILIAAVAGGLLLIGNNHALAQRPSYGGSSRANMGSSSPSQSTSEASGTNGAKVATPITKADAQKKYPARNGKYPMADRDPHEASGVVSSPYPPYTKYDCSAINHGDLVLDTRANKVFVRP